MKGLFSRKKVGDKSSKNENSNKVGTTEKKVERITGQKRLFYINDQERNNLIAPQTPNYIRTTKYTLWTFLPLSLMFQFKRLPNFYFLIQAILNSITIVSAMNPISAYLPLAFVLAVSMLREAVEDYQRYRSDKVTNKQGVNVIQYGRVVTGEAKNLKVGDLVLCQADEMFPADLILIASSDQHASCFI